MTNFFFPSVICWKATFRLCENGQRGYLEKILPFHRNISCLTLASSSVLAHTGSAFWTSLLNRRDGFCAELVHWMTAGLAAPVAKGYPKTFSLCQGISEFTVFPLLNAQSADKSLVSYPALSLLPSQAP